MAVENVWKKMFAYKYTLMAPNEGYKILWSVRECWNQQQDYKPVKSVQN